MWKNIWQKLLVILDREDKLTWKVTYLDGTFASAKKGAKVDKTKRGKGTKTMLAVDGTGIPLTFLTEAANISEFKLALPTIDQISVESRPLHPRKRPDTLVADKGYDAMWLRHELSDRGIKHKIPKRRKKEKRMSLSITIVLKVITKLDGLLKELMHGSKTTDVLR